MLRRDTGAMGTDNWPVHFRYISGRQLDDIVQQSEAARPRWQPTLLLNLKIASIGLTKIDPGYRNKYLLCRKATEEVRDHTGTLAHPGDLVRDEFELRMGYLTVHRGWQDRTNVRIAAMMNVVSVEGVGEVLVALFGSESNYVWKRPADSDRCEIPSDVDGLYGLLNATREPVDPPIESDFLDADPEHEDFSRADLVVRLLEDRHEGFRVKLLDVLARVFYCIDDYSFAETHYDRVLIGSPVWAATPVPRVLATSHPKA